MDTVIARCFVRRSFVPVIFTQSLFRTLFDCVANNSDKISRFRFVSASKTNGSHGGLVMRFCCENNDPEFDFFMSSCE